MKKLMLGLVALAALVVSAAALATPSPASTKEHCENLLRKAPGAYPSLSACVAAGASVATQSSTNAVKACKVEQDGDAAAFATLHGGKSFADFYGTNGNKKNAFGKCVSAKADKSVADSQAAEIGAASKCKAMRVDPAFAAAHGGKSFADFYGTNANKKNAFAKCVSTTAKAKHS